MKISCLAFSIDGKFSSNLIPASCSFSKITPFAVSTKLLLILLAIAEAPLLVILGLIALIFSFTVYSIVALWGSVLLTEVISLLKFFGTTILA